MEDEKNSPILPLNYCSLSHLQERWIKEHQRKQEEKVQQQQQQRRRDKHHLQQDIEPNFDAQKLKEAPEIRRHGNWKYPRGSRNLKASGSPQENHVVVVAVVEGNESGSAVDEIESKDLGDNEMKKKKKKKKKKKEKTKKNQKDKEKMIKDGEARAQAEGKVMVREAHAPPAKGKKENIPERRFARRRSFRLDFRPKITSIVEKSDNSVEVAEEVKNVVEESEGIVETKRKLEDLSIEKQNDGSQTQNSTDNRVEMVEELMNVAQESEGNVEIKRKLGDLCIGKQNEGSKTQNTTVNCNNSEYRGYNRISNPSHIQYRGYNRTVNRSNTEYTSYYGIVHRGNSVYRGYNGGGNRRNGHYRGNYERLNRYMARKEKHRGDGMVWVKKEEVADGTEGA